MSGDLPIIYVDDREDTYILNQLKDRYNVEVMHLEIGDYVCNNVVIEYKSLEDFIKSVYQGRIFAQCEDLLSNTEFYPYILIGSKLSLFEAKGYRDIDIIDTITSLNVRGVTTMLVDSEDTLIKYMISLFRKHSDGKNRHVLPVRKGVTYEDLVMNNYASIPIIGDKLSPRFKDRFPIPRMLYNATIDDLKRVDGIADKKAKTIYNFINGTEENDTRTSQVS